MKNTKFIEEAKLHPSRIYNRPLDVLRDRRLNDVDRLEILTSWERTVRESEGQGAPPDQPSRLGDVVQARQEVEERMISGAGSRVAAAHGPTRH